MHFASLMQPRSALLLPVLLIVGWRVQRRQAFLLGGEKCGWQGRSALRINWVCPCSG